MNRIKQLREEFGMMQQELADKLNGAKSTVAMYEKEDRNPSLEILIKLSEIYDWHIEDVNDMYINIDKVNAIALNYNRIGTYIDEKYVLAEKFGHYYSAATYSPYCQDFQLISKQERKAKKWAYSTLIPFDALKRAFQKGILETYDLAEYFEVSEKFMYHCLSFYLQKYGSLYLYDCKNE